ncbi:hypothetical protein CF68_33135 [Cupriavidus sp. SK-4]|uniref:hypothetical protein n=1 Tax=Cupriavidus sp. SK-4 TaxID=574750 RepID=UPI00044EF6B1|nr:hypothetical protein [Cupriavidus sp. SK-4]EYS89534.1 hypothetical protein CF68_33135 [Cupriavidus sp. SK-4]
MKVIRNLIARLLRLPAMPASPAAVTPAVPAVRRPTRASRELAIATVPWHVRPVTAEPEAKDGASALSVAMLMASCSEEGFAADAGSFGLPTTTE